MNLISNFCQYGFILITFFVVGVKASSATRMSLEDAIKKGIENSPDLKSFDLDLEAGYLTFEDAKDTMYLPNLTLDVNLDAARTLVTLPNSDASAFGGDSKSNGHPTSSFGVTLGEYNLYNSGKDNLIYLQAKLEKRRAERAFEESYRNFELDVISSYMTAVVSAEKVKAAKESLLIAKALRRLVKSLKKLKKVGLEDVSSANSDVLDAQNDLNAVESEHVSNIWNLNALIGDPIGTTYTLTTKFNFRPLKISSAKTLRIFFSSSNELLNAETDIENGRLALELERKNRLPLPTVKFTGLEAKYSQQFFGGKFNYTTTSPVSSGNFDFQVGISFSIPLVGPGGFLNDRVYRQALIQYERSKAAYEQLKLNGKRDILLAYINIQRDQKSIPNLRQIYIEAIQILKEVQKKTVRGTATRFEIQDAIRNARDAEFNLKDTLLSHLTQKVDLAKRLGRADLPGGLY